MCTGRAATLEDRSVSIGATTRPTTQHVPASSPRSVGHRAVTTPQTTCVRTTLVNGSSPGMILFPTRDTWPCLETFLVVTTRSDWHPVGGGQGRAKQDGPHHGRLARPMCHQRQLEQPCTKQPCTVLRNAPAVSTPTGPRRASGGSSTRAETLVLKPASPPQPCRRPSAATWHLPSHLPLAHAALRAGGPPPQVLAWRPGPAPLSRLHVSPLLPPHRAPDDKAQRGAPADPIPRPEIPSQPLIIDEQRCGELI